MANSTSKTRQAAGTQDKQRKQQGGKGGNQQQQQNPAQPRPLPGREPDVHDDMSDDEFGSDSNRDHKNIDVERS